MKTMRVKTKDAAALLGVAVLDVRCGLIDGHYKFGEAIQTNPHKVKWGSGKRNYKYLVFSSKLADYLGITEQELWKRIEELA